MDWLILGTFAWELIVNAWEELIVNASELIVNAVGLAPFRTDIGAFDAAT